MKEGAVRLVKDVEQVEQGIVLTVKQAVHEPHLRITTIHWAIPSM